MALRDQPYLPLYIQDFLTDEKLRECSAEAVGAYIMIMCIMHKSKEYGQILLKQNDKQNDKQILNFACKLEKHLPWTNAVILRCLTELVDEGVLVINNDSLMQPRMVEDNRISLLRSTAGKKGYFAKANHKANSQANTENENEIESNNTYSISIGGQKFSKKLSEILQNEYGFLFETCMMTNYPGKNKDLILKAMDKAYPIYDFSDQNHLLKALQKIGTTGETLPTKKTREIK